MVREGIAGRMTNPAEREAALTTAGSDAHLVGAIRRREQVALTALYDRYSGLVYTLALRILGDRGLAEEVVQDVFLRCWDRAETFQLRRGSVAAWLLGITRNRAIDVLRGRLHHARQREQPAYDLPGLPDPAWQGDLGDAMALRDAVSNALSTLPQAQRQVIELAYYGGLTQSDIARLLGEPLGTVKTRTHAGMERLRRLLRPVFIGEMEGQGHHGAG